MDCLGMRSAVVVLILTCILFGTDGQKTLEDKIAAIFNHSRNETTDEIPDAFAGFQGDPCACLETGECECVPYYLCSTNFSAIADELGGFRHPTYGGDVDCNSYLEVCCKLSDKIDEPTVPLQQSTRGCGFRNVALNLAGDENSESQFGEFPWMVAILREEVNVTTNKVSNVYKCGGALIHPQVVLTAAHCVVSQEKKYTIRAGEWDTQTTNELYPHQERFVKNTVIHTMYHAGGLINDLAVVFLESPFEIAENVNTLCLPEQDTVLPNGSRCFQTGWGKDNFGKEGIHSVVLKRTDLFIVDPPTCQKKLQTTRLGTHFELDKSFICADGEEGKGICKSDGGSPLVCLIPGEQNRYQQIGIASWGIGCAQNGIPAVYVNVGLYRNWVDEQMSLYGLDKSFYQF